MTKTDNYITSKEFYTYMDGFRKEMIGMIEKQNIKIDKYGNDFVEFEKGKLTGLLIDMEKVKSKIDLENATFNPTKKIVDRVIDIALYAIVTGVLAMLFLHK